MKTKIIALLSLALTACISGSNSAEIEKKSGLRVVMLGTGTPHPDPDRSGPAVAVIANDKSYLFDAGPGVVRRASAARRAHGIEALAPPALKTAFLTHLHSDHTLGLPDLIFTPWTLFREEPLHLFGPPGTAAMAENLTAAYEVDIHLRLSGDEPANETGYKVITSEISKGGLVFEDGDVRIEAIPVLHGTWEHAFGYKITKGDQTIVISGDARPTPALIEAARNADILVHEVYSAEGFQKNIPSAWQAYHSQFHTSSVELADIAETVQPKLLVLYHQLYFKTDDETILSEIRGGGYEGKVVSANDLDIFDVGEPK